MEQSTIEYKWGFPAFDVTYSVGELQNVVSTVHWTLTATEGTYTASTYGSLGVDEPAPEQFVAYEELTEEEVIQWVTDTMGEEQVQSMEDRLASQIKSQKEPVSGTMTPPWNNVPVLEQPYIPVLDNIEQSL